MSGEPLLTKFGSVDACAAQKTRASFQQETILTSALSLALREIRKFKSLKTIMKRRPAEGEHKAIYVEAKKPL